jgi:hypothetical protein
MSEEVRQGDPDWTSDNDGLYGERGTLDQGYGRGEQMGEEQWSREWYEQQARHVDGKTLDNLPEGERGDVDRMAGGMFAPDETMDDVDLGADDTQEEFPREW